MNPNGPQHPAHKNQRRTGRLNCEELQSNFGPVIDLSSQGCRIIQSRFTSVPVGASIRLRLEGYECCVTVPAEIMRRRGRGPFRVELGVRFLDLTPEEQAAIAAIARTHSVRYAIIRQAA